MQNRWRFQKGIGLLRFDIEITSEAIILNLIQIADSQANTIKQSRNHSVTKSLNHSINFVVGGHSERVFVAHAF